MFLRSGSWRCLILLTKREVCRVQYLTQVFECGPRERSKPIFVQKSKGQYYKGSVQTEQVK